MIKIDKELLDLISNQAKESPRKRKNYNFHKHDDDTLQRLLNAIEPFSYIQPHKHENPDKREVFTVMRGRILVVEFDEQGEITDHIIVDPSRGNYGAEIPEKRCHAIFALDPGSIIYEIKDGPYSPVNDKNFAPWAPKEEDNEEVREYILSVFKRVGVSINEQ